MQQVARGRWVALGAWLAGSSLGCGGPWDASSAAPFALSAAGGRELDEVGAVSRFHVSGDIAWAPADVWLVSGEVSSTSAKRMARRDPPDTVAGHRVPLAVWPDAEGQLFVPLEMLKPGERYTFVALGYGYLGSFQTSTDSSPLLSRVGSGPVSPGDWLVYCADGPLPHFEPTGQVRISTVGRASPRAGVADSGILSTRCVSLRVPKDAEAYVVPSLGDDEIWLSPLPLAVIEREAGAETRNSPESWCAAGELEQCTRVRRAAIEVEVGPGSSALRASPVDGGMDVLEGWGSAESGLLVLGPLRPGVRYRLDATRVRGAEARTHSMNVPARAAEGRLVLNEVLANPLGPEPDAEWVEVYNAGTAPVRLSDFSLGDSGKTSRLPEGELAPGRYGVVVSFAYRANPDLDVVPRADALPILVPFLGQSGLLNSGEVVSLYDAEGDLASRIPAVATAAGVSLARRSPWLPDEPRSFGPHAPPGASPGGPNELEDP